MLEFLRRMFAGRKRSGRRAQLARLMLESLENRDLPNAGPLFSAFHSLAQGNPGHFGPPMTGFGDPGAQGNPGQNGPAMPGFGDPGHQCGAEGQTQTLSATLTGATGTSGSVTFRSNTTTGDNTLKVQVSGLSADATYTAESGTTALGTITTDANGNGQLSVSNLSPALTAGANITVLDSQSSTALSGTLAAATGQTATRLSASLSGATGTAGNAAFYAGDTSGENSLRVWVSGLTASSTYTVQVDGTTLGQLTMDANGRGRLLASNFSTAVAAGSTVTVVDSSGTTVLKGTFAADSGFQGGWFHGGWFHG